KAPPKLVSRKYFCASSQVISSRAGAALGHGASSDPQFSVLGCFFAYRRWTRAYSTSLVSLSTSRSSNLSMLAKLFTPETRRYTTPRSPPARCATTPQKPYPSSSRREIVLGAGLRWRIPGWGHEGWLPRHP